MLVLRRKSGQWCEITHKSGDVLRVRLVNLRMISPVIGQAELIFDDEARNFEIERPERARAATVESIPES